jgi:hypothetical protein
MSSKRKNLERKREERYSEAELAARETIEQCFARRLSDDEWKVQRHRLAEFILMLGRWETEQRHAADERR